MVGPRQIGVAVALVVLLSMAGAVFWLGRPRPVGVAPVSAPGVETRNAEKPADMAVRPPAGAPGANPTAPAGGLSAEQRQQVARAPEPPTARPPAALVPQPDEALRSRPDATAPPASTGGPNRAGSPPPGLVPPARTGAASSDPSTPGFDIVRVEPTGEAVIAGRGVPNGTVELIRNGHIYARGAADASGLFALVPPPLPPGSHEVVLQTIAPDGTRARSRVSVTVVVSDHRAPPLVALTSPDEPTVVLSQPEASEARTAALAPAGPAAPSSLPPSASANPPGSSAPPNATAPIPPSVTPQGSSPQVAANALPPSLPPAAARMAPTLPRSPVKVVSVEAEEGGRLYVSGEATPGSTVRLYLNETLIAPGDAGRDGRISFAIGRGIRAGDYRVRLDDVDPASGEVKSRAEVTFNMPAALGGPAPLPAPSAPARVATQPPTSGPPARPQTPPATVQAPPAAVQPSTPAPQVALALPVPPATPPGGFAQTSRPGQPDAPSRSTAPGASQPSLTGARSQPGPAGEAGGALPSRSPSENESRPPPASTRTSRDATRPSGTAPPADGRPAVELASPEPDRQAALSPPRPSVGAETPPSVDASRPPEPVPPAGDRAAAERVSPEPGRQATLVPTSPSAGTTVSRDGPGSSSRPTAAPSTLAPAAERLHEPAVAAAAPPAAAVRELDPGTILIPEVNTAIVSRGDNLWRISRRVYGRGLRYTVIYSANQEQIRNRHLIYPGQVFVLPGEQEATRR